MSDDVEEEEEDDDDAPTDGAVAPRLAGTTDGGADEFCVKDKVRGTMVCNGDAAVGESPLGSSTTIDEVVIPFFGRSGLANYKGANHKGLY